VIQNIRPPYSLYTNGCTDTGAFVGVFAVKYNMPTIYVWLFADMATAIPIFINVLALAVLLPTFEIT